MTDRKLFLNTWKELPPANEVQSAIHDCHHSADVVQQKLEKNNVFTIARRSVDVGMASQVRKMDIHHFTNRQMD